MTSDRDLAVDAATAHAVAGHGMLAAAERHPAASDGTARRTAELRSSARASSRVRSRGVLASNGGGPPTVSERPGSTITKWVPRAANSPIT